MQPSDANMKKSSEDLDLAKIVFFLQPSKPILCTTKDVDGTDHVAPFGWCMPVSQRPPMLAIAIHHSPEKAKTLENIERTGEFVINVPHLELAEATVRTSFQPGGTLNKVDVSGFTRQESKQVSPVSIQECVASLECKTGDIRYVGDHALIIGKVVFVSYDPAAYKGLSWNIAHFRPLIHLGHHCLKSGAQVHEFFSGSNDSIKYTFEKIKNVPRSSK